ncbi:MAG: hypothetical protein NC927_01420, partial [Candidatus Omnitrophica bacterium]|nr:hypothetical protein [Candidatus Omnitrophota bacterium]
KDKETLILNLFWESVKLSQSWRLSFKDNHLIWQIVHEGKTKLGVLKFGIIFQPEYKRYFCGYEEGEFPEDFTVWQDMALEDSGASYFGLRKEEDLPAVVFQRSGEGTFALIQNSDKISTSRVLQMIVGEKLLFQEVINFTTQITFLEKEDFIEDYIKKEEARLRLFRTITSGELSLYADVEAKSLRLYYRDKEISKGSGLYSSFYVNKRWFCSSDAKWQVIKNSENKLILTFEFPEIFLSQIWNLNLIDENTLTFDIEIENFKEISLMNMEVKLEFVDQYKGWSTELEEGDFLREQFIHNISPIRLKDNKINKVNLISNNKDFPLLTFATISQKGESVFYLCKKRNAENEIINEGNFTLLIPKREQLLLPGKYKCFEGLINLGRDCKVFKVIKRDVEKIKSGRLEFIFESGKGRIFWKDKELTTGLGVFTSLRYLGIWRDSYQGVWQIIEKNATSILVLGEWPFIPVMQDWKLKLLNENLIKWRIETEIFEEIALEIEQANLMLSNKYKEWIVPHLIKGNFSEEFTADYNILPYRFWSGKVKEGIGVINEILPEILFRINLGNPLIAVIENTDDLYCARLLQYQKSNN